MGNCSWNCLSDRPLNSPTFSSGRAFNFDEDKKSEEKGSKDQEDTTQINEVDPSINSNSLFREEYREPQKPQEPEEIEPYEESREENPYKVVFLEHRSVKEIAAELDRFYSQGPTKNHHSEHAVRAVDRPIVKHRTRGKRKDFDF